MNRPISIRSFATAALALSLGPATFGQARDLDTPAAELASFTLAEGFKASLFASETDGVVKPIQIRFDARGRLWVIGSTVYPQIQPGQDPQDKVLILEDTDGDGRSDKTTVFAEGLMIPTGLETIADGTGCYVGHGTELLLLKDTDGDDRADQRTVVLRGFGTGDNHQNINSFAWDPNGNLWFCQGLHAHGRVETPFGIVKLDQAGIWRLNPRSRRLEGFYGSAADPQNPWGFVFSDWGEPLELAGNNGVIIYPSPGLVKKTKPAQPANIWPAGRGRKMSGGEIVGTTHFPDAWQGRLITGGYLNNAIWSMTVEDQGSGFAIVDAAPLLTSSHASFRPVDVKFGPDGALYVCDWYNPIIGHYQASFRHPDRDKNHGRIWRITAQDRPLTPPPRLASASLTHLSDNLASPDRWTRQFARRLLAEKPPEEIKDWLDAPLPPSTAPTPPTNPPAADPNLAIREQLGIKHRHGTLRWDHVAPLITSPHPALRAAAASLIPTVPEFWASPAAAAALRTLATDDHPRVRLHTITASTYLTGPEAVEIALIATDRPTDSFIDYALDQAVFSLKPQWLPAFREGTLTFDNQPDRLARFVRADGTADTLEAVRRLWSAPNLSPATRKAFLTILARAGEAADLSTVLTLEDKFLLESLLPEITQAALVRNLQPPGDLTAVVRSLLAMNSPAVREESWRLVGAWRLENMKPELLAQATSSAGAMTGLLALDPVAAATAMARDLTSDGAADRLPSLLPPFFRRQDAPDHLARALATTPPPPAAAAAALQVMSERGLHHPAVHDLLLQAAPPAPRSWTWSSEFAQDLTAEVMATGDIARGREIFRRAELTCVACHAIAGDGGKIGPALDAVGAAQPVDFLIGAVLAPQKELKEGYEAVQATTKTGDVVIGYRAPGAPQDLNLRQPDSGEISHIPRSNLETEKSLGSLMPANLVNSLTREELRDLFRYLASLGKTAP